MPLREWFYLAVVATCVVAGGVYDGEGGPVLASLGGALLFAAMFWSSRKQRLTGKPWRKL